jgi:hypothetical protein
VKIKKGEWYRILSAPCTRQHLVGMVQQAPRDDEAEPGWNYEHVRVDVRKRRVLKPSEALAWLTRQPEWHCGGDSPNGPGFELCWWASAKVDGSIFRGMGRSLTRAIIELRKDMGVR